jgi:DNA-binding PadR family transcriptional regulator
MSRAELTPFSYRVLALIGREGAGPHDLVQYMRRGRVYAGAAESQYYAETKRLAALGYLDAEKRPGKTRERTHYTLTDKGLRALSTWADDPCAFSGIESEAIIRVLATDLVGEPRTRESLAALRGEIETLHGFLDEAERVAETLPHRRKYLLLNHRLARAILRTYSDWLDEVDRELAPVRTATRSPRASRGRSAAGPQRTTRR